MQRIAALVALILLVGAGAAQDAKNPSFAGLGGDPSTNIYVTYYVPMEDDEAFRAHSQAKYATVDALRAAWSMAEEGAGYETQAAAEEALPDSFQEVTLASAPSGTRAHADLQDLRAHPLDRDPVLRRQHP